MYLYIELNSKSPSCFARVMHTSESAISFFKRRLENRISFAKDTGIFHTFEENFNADT